MNIEELREYALSLKGTTEDLKWGENLCIMVHEKIFLVLGIDEIPPTIALKVEEEIFDELTSIDGIKQAPYFAKRQWIKIDSVNNFNNTQWKEFILNSYKLVTSKLTKKAQKELGLIV